MERTDGHGEPSEKPADYLAIQVPDGVVLEKEFVERTKPESTHGGDNLEEDDSFLSIGSETWDYHIRDSREQEFIDAAKNSGMVIEYVQLSDAADPTE